MIRRPTMSLRARLLAGMAVVAIVLVVVSAVITLTTRGLLIDQIDDRLASFSPAGRADDFGRFPGPEFTVAVTSGVDGSGGVASSGVTPAPMPTDAPVTGI